MSQLAALCNTLCITLFDKRSGVDRGMRIIIESDDNKPSSLVIETRVLELENDFVVKRTKASGECLGTRRR